MHEVPSAIDQVGLASSLRQCCVRFIDCMAIPDEMTIATRHIPFFFVEHMELVHREPFLPAWNTDADVKQWDQVQP